MSVGLLDSIQSQLEGLVEAGSKIAKEERIDSWAVALCELTSNQAAQLLISDYMGWIREAEGDGEAKRRGRHLAGLIDDPNLSEHDKVCVILQQISGRYQDNDFLGSMKRRIKRHRKAQEYQKPSGRSRRGRKSS